LAVVVVKTIFGRKLRRVDEFPCNNPCYRIFTFGTLALIRTGHGLARLEWHVTPKFDLYGYYGGEYAWRAGYKGYNAITITKTAAIPATSATSGTPPVTVTTPAIPATTTTTFSLNGIGGYGNVAANNFGCATEGVPVNDFNPSSGSNCAGDIR